MANWYSDRIGADGSADSSLPTIATISSVGIAGGRLRMTHASITVLDTAAADVLWMLRMKSSDRIWAIYYGTDGGFSASGSSELGIYTANSTYDGAALAVDLFGGSISLTSAVDVLTEAFSLGALGGEDRMKTLWEQLAIGDQSYTVDPKVNFDIAMTLDGNDDVTSSTLTVDVIYTAGD